MSTQSDNRDAMNRKQVEVCPAMGAYKSLCQMDFKVKGLITMWTKGK